MNRPSNFVWILAAALALAVCGPAVAGSSCEQRKIGSEEVQKAMQMAYKTRQALEESGAEVALVGRVGSDLSEHDLRYTHAGAVLRDHPAGRWLFIHLLNSCGTDASGIFDEGLVNFFLDDLFAFEAVILVPSQPLQQRLAQVLRSDLTTALHTSVYSMIANPFSIRYQNSNQWLLEIIAAATEPEGAVKNRGEAQAVLMRRGFKADEIRIGNFQRLGAGMFRANVRFDDHDQAEERSGRYRVVTVRSLARFLDTVDTPKLKLLIPLTGPNQKPVRY